MLCTMRASRRWVILLLVLLMACLVAWWRLGDDTRSSNTSSGQAVTPVPNQPRPAAEPVHKTPSVSDRGAVATPRPREPGQGTTPEPPVDLDACWTVRGRLVAVTLDGLNLLPLMGRSEPEISVAWLDLRDDRCTHREEVVAPGAEGSIEAETGLILRDLPDPLALLWQFTVAGYGPGSLEQFLDAWNDAEPDARPDPKTLTGLHRPRVSGHVLDFGDLRLDLGSHPNSPEVLAGRILLPGGLPLCSRQGLEVRTPRDYEPELSFSGRVNTEGRFAILVSQEELQEYGSPDLAAARWELEINADTEGWAGMGLRSMQLSSTRLVYPLPAPSRRQRLLDFGDIHASGAVLELHAGVEGVTPPARLGDPLLHEDDYETALDRELEVWLDSGDESFCVHAPLGITLRLILAESRLSWTADYHNPELPCRTRTGSVAVRKDRSTRLDIMMRPAPLVPVRLELPQGVLSSAVSVTWVVPLGLDEWWDGPATSELRVPVQEGLTTEVTGELPGYESVAAEARVGDKEVLLRFTTPAAPPPRLLVKLPLLPEALGDKLAGTLKCINAEGQGGHKSVTLQRGEQPAVAVEHLPAGTYTLSLHGDDLFGYPGGRVSILEGVAVAAAGDTEVTLPEIPAPPWPYAAGNVRVRVTVGGNPATILAIFEDAAGEASWRTLTDGELILAAEKSAHGRRAGPAIPVALAHGSLRIPLQVSPPTAAGGEALVSLDLPARLRVTVWRAGQQLVDFAASLYSPTVGGRCSALASGGQVLLWCPAGEGGLSIEQEGLMLHESTVQVPAEGELPLKLVLDVARLKLLPGADDDETDSTEWQLRGPGPNQEQSVSPGQILYLKPGKYRLVPDEPVDPSHALEVDLSDGVDREVTLPSIPPVKTANVLLAMSESDWEGYQYASIEVFLVPTVPGAETSLAYRGREAIARSMPDGLLLLDLPVDRRVLIRGYVTRIVGGALQNLVMRPADVVVQKDLVVPPHWRKASSLGPEWFQVSVFCISDFPGFALLLGSDGQIAPGRHQVLVIDGDGKELARTWIEIPAEAEDFPIPPDLRQRLVDAGELEPDEPDPTEED